MQDSYRRQLGFTKTLAHTYTPIHTQTIRRSTVLPGSDVKVSVRVLETTHTMSPAACEHKWYLHPYSYARLFITYLAQSSRRSDATYRSARNAVYGYLI
jgi:hypothetical protein